LVGTIGNGKASDLAFLETSAPEPGTWMLMGIGFLALIAFRRRLAC
jgi:PEP-CTERM motif